ncbi:MAG: hypothetical protein LBH43_11110 [Treponema sp.]|nr:hypothetical protein [Treponema sp.]
MKTKFTSMEKQEIIVKCHETLGYLSYQNHSFGIGGVNSLPIPPRVSSGIKALKPKLVRIFLQEFFYIYPDHNVFNWDKMDAYLEAVHTAGADIMAHITIKPKPLYPVIDETIWKPNDVKEWQGVIETMVRRYSLEKKYISHWAVANEINIGELGGCPYKFTSPHDYFEYYKMTAQAIIKACPGVKVGGPAWAGTGEVPAAFFGVFFDLVKKEKLRLDFISYNMYTDIPQEHVEAAKLFRQIADKYDKNLELYTTEFNVRLDSEIAFEENAYAGARAASLAASILAMQEAQYVNGTFQYHIVDQHNSVNEFSPFYKITRYMAEHWNDFPHRLGLFDWDGNPRPQYFMYKLLYGMDGERLSLGSGGNEHIHAAASSSGNRDINIFISNYHDENPKDIISRLCLKNNPASLYRLTVYRIDNEKRWDETLELKPVEDRLTYMADDFSFLVFTPADSVTLICLKSLEAAN